MLSSLVEQTRGNFNPTNCRNWVGDGWCDEGNFVAAIHPTCNYLTVYGFQLSLSGLFEDNKLTCSFLIATALQRHAGEISPTEWSLLLRLARVAVGILSNKWQQWCIQLISLHMSVNMNSVNKPIHICIIHIHKNAYAQHSNTSWLNAFTQVTITQKTSKSFPGLSVVKGLQSVYCC